MPLCLLLTTSLFLPSLSLLLLSPLSFLVSNLFLSHTFLGFSTTAPIFSHFANHTQLHSFFQNLGFGLFIIQQSCLSNVWNYSLHSPINSQIIFISVLQLLSLDWTRMTDLPQGWERKDLPAHSPSHPPVLLPFSFISPFAFTPVLLSSC